MGNLFGGGGSSPATPAATSSAVAAQNSTIGGITSDPAGRSISSGGFVDDGTKRMPSAGDAAANNAAKRVRQQLVSRSGRTATDLTGTRAYVAPFLGNTN